MSVNTDILNGIIYGRVEPHIYAFTTQTVPNYLKVGDTYRPVHIRLGEWSKHYKNLKKEFEHTAKVNDNTFFRDYSVHAYLESKDFHRRPKEEFAEGVYPSNEFFREASSQDVQEAIDDIQASFENRDNRYDFYSTEDRLPLGEMEYERNADWQPRDNQQEVIEAFKKAVDAGRTNLLMYAVMRFGKSFTALCCAKEMEAKLVVIVCGKTAVRDEWKINVQRPKILEGYHFVTTESLRANPNAVSEFLTEGKSVVVFLTLQDLLGNDVKEHHKDLFEHNGQGHIDLLIIDESHFAARSEETGKVLNGLKASSIKKELEAYDQDFTDLEEPVKLFAPKIKLHLSGTPYRILMDGEFQKEDIIAFVQYNDIIDEQQRWDDENLEKDEWENPYYGFPQMVRFAFNLNQSAINRLNELRNEGFDYRLNTLLHPLSLTASGNYKKFKYENEVLDLLKAIDGSKEDANIFSFLNYDRIKEGKMCRHMVMVLPFRASCDAMKKLLSTEKFVNLNEYEVLNLAGLECPPKYSGSDYANQLKNDIESYESIGKKTITLTVGKMLTGSTVREWDTMIFLKDASSPQEYDQAIFRLQSQYVKTIKSEEGKEIRYNMKPQTLLVDFDPTRMFVMQNRKSLISNINTSIAGNDELAVRLQHDLKISPIIWLNKDKLQQVEPANIIDAVRRYSANKSIMDETFDVAVDDGVFDDTALKALIEKEWEMSPFGNVFAEKPYKGEEGDVETGDNATPTSEENDSNQPNQTNGKTEENELKSLRKKLQTYYFKLLLFAYLSDAEEKSLNDIIRRIEDSEDGKRIAKNLNLDVETVKLIRERIHPMALNELENKINNVDDLGEDMEANVQTAMRRFSRLSGSEIITPEWVAKKMVDALPDDVTAESRFLNIAGKIGEFEYALCEKYGEAVKQHIYTIPTSGITYECTRKMFRMMGIPTENIFTDFTSFDLIDKKKNKDIMENLRSLGVDVVLGNPPYEIGKNREPIYHHFMDFGQEVGNSVTMIHPARFLFNAGKTPKPWNQKKLSDRNFRVIQYSPVSKTYFPKIDVDIKGGVAITQWNKMQEFEAIGKFIGHDELRSILQKVMANNDEGLSLIVYPRDLYKLAEKFYEENSWAASRQSVGHKYDVGTSFFDIFPEILYDDNPEQNTENYAMIYGRNGNNRIVKWIKREYLRIPDNFESYKVFITKANGTGNLGEVLSTPVVGEPLMGHTVTFLSVGNFRTEEEANNLISYLKTKFARTMLGTLKVTQDNPSSTWANVPLQDFTSQSDIDWTQSVADIDNQLYAKYSLSEREIEFIETMIKPME